MVAQRTCANRFKSLALSLQKQPRLHTKNGNNSVLSALQ